MKRAALFQPITIGKVEIKNRLAMTPLCLNYNLKGGLVSDQTKAFFAARAKGGVGLIILGTLTVSQVVKARRVESGFMMMDHTAKPGLCTLAEIIHMLGAKVFMQFSLGFGHQTSTRDQWPDPTVEPIAASPITFKILPSALPKKAVEWHKKRDLEFKPSRAEGLMPREATIEEIEEIEDTQAEGAAALKALGYDGVEIHCGHGYFGAEFLSPRTNFRTDKYGGSPEKRMTFLKNMYHKIRQKVGKDFVVGMRISVAEYVPGGQTLEDTKFICQEMERLGLNYISLTGGCYEAFKYIEPDEDGTALDGAAEIKKVVKLPIITPSIHDPDMAEKAVAEGKTDMIGLARALLADPNWPNKVAEGKRPVKCIRCLAGCWDRVVLGLPIRCTVNPECGFEQYIPEYWPERPFKRSFEVMLPHLRVS